MKKFSVLFFVFSMFVLTGCSVSSLGNNSNDTKPNIQACTEEAKLCPDGSAVGRTGPNCEFAPCPESKSCTCPAGYDQVGNICNSGCLKSNPPCLAPSVECQSVNNLGDLPPSNGFPVGDLPGSEMPVACTMDARICPDGSAVGRIAPNCEFAPCPGE
jgi:hypothetical protein